MDVAIHMSAMTKERFKALLYYVLILLAVHFTGCRNSLQDTTTTDGGGNGTATLTSPTQVSGTAMSTAEIGVSWINTDSPDLQKVELEYKKSADAAYTTVDVNTASDHSLTGLEAGTAYDIRLKSIATNNEESDYSELITVTTLAEVIDDSHPLATISSANVYDGKVIIVHTWSSADNSHIQNIYCESKLVTGSVWAAYNTGTSANFGNLSYCTTNLNGAENIGKRQYRIRVHFNDGALDSISAVTAVLVAKLPAPTNVNISVANLSLLSWNWLETYDPLYHTGFSIHYSYSPPSIFFANNGSGSTAYNDYDYSTNICSTVLIPSLGSPWDVTGPISFTLQAIGGNSTAHHDYPQSSAVVTGLSGTCP